MSETPCGTVARGYSAPLWESCLPGALVSELPDSILDGRLEVPVTSGLRQAGNYFRMGHNLASK